MTQQHPISPPQELVEQWFKRFESAESLAVLFCSIFQDGANQELDACCKWLESQGWRSVAQNIRAARRPKPKSEKQQALEAFDRIEYAPSEAEDFAIIHRALESIPDDQ
jgi:inorganic triphosphatase YgiF